MSDEDVALITDERYQVRFKTLEWLDKIKSLLRK